MFESYYKNKFIRAASEMQRYGSQIGKLESFEDAVQKYHHLNELHDKVIELGQKVPHDFIESKDSAVEKEVEKLDNLYNILVINSLTKPTPKQSSESISKVIIDLKRSYGYGFDSYIREYLSQLDKILNNLDNIYFNYKNGNVNKDKLNKKKEITISSFDREDEPLYNEIVEFVVAQGKTSAALLQRKFMLGYNRAARAIDFLEEDGIVGPQNGARPRDVLIKLGSNDGTTLIESSENHKKLIDFAEVYGMNYKEVEAEKDLVRRVNTDYENNIQELFNKKGLKILFDQNKKIDLLLLKNVLFTNSEDDNITNFINTLMSFSTPDVLKLVLIDFSKINLIDYNELPNLLFQVAVTEKCIDKCLNDVKKIIDSRYDVLIKEKCKSIEQYNQINDEQSLNYIVVVISEIQDILLNANQKTLLTEMLANCSKVGVKFIAFSKFSRKNIQLFMLDDLFKVYSNYDTRALGIDNGKKISIDNIDNDMNGFDFEKYSGEILQASGFENINVTQCSNDFGVDIVAYKDDIKYAIQCKKYSSAVGIKAVQEVIASKTMNDCHVAVVLTNNYFTKSAKELARKNNVLLWDRDKLIEMMKKLK